MPTVIVADDEEDIRLLCRVNLEPAGFVVHEAASADELMSLARTVLPDVIVLDVTMPRRDGWQCLVELKADTALGDVPVVMLSAHVEEESRRRALSLGARDYLAKPFHPDALVSVVRAAADA